MFQIQTLSFILFLFFSFFTHAQDGDVEKIEVTGSHIKRIQSEGVSPLTIIDREQIDFSGAVSLDQLLQNLSIASFGAMNKGAILDLDDLAVSSFRGLPPGYTLILLNGSRLKSLNDLDLIPISAVERIEILTDGASATYGADALGGVMNIITKKGDIGTTVSVQAYAPELQWSQWNKNKDAKITERLKSLIRGGESLKADVTYGEALDDYQYLLAFTIARTQRILRKDRPYSLFDKKTDATFFSIMGSPGSYSIDGKNWLPMPGCPGGPGASADASTKYPSSIYYGNHCRFNYSEHMELTPTVNTIGTFLTMDFDNDVNINVLYNYENSLSVIAPAPDKIKSDREGFGPWIASIASAHSDIPNVASLQELRYRMVYEKGSGKRLQRVHRNLLSFNVNKETDLSDYWSLDTSVNADAIVSFSNNKNYVDKRKLLELENGKAKWDPFLDKGNKNDVTYARYLYEGDEYMASLIPEVKLDGELVNFGKLGSLNMAIGGRAGYEYWNGTTDEVTWDSEKQKSHQFGGGSGTYGSGGRYFGTLYTEFLLPLNLGNINTLEIQLAGSADYYQYIGFASSMIHIPYLKKDNKAIPLPFNPKIAAKWSIADVILFRGSVGTGFKVPSLKNLFATQVTDHPIFTDHNCPNPPCEPTQHEALYKGNKNLKPEKAKTYNVGVAFQPSEYIHTSLDYFYSHIKDMIPTKPDGNVITKMESEDTDTSNAYETFKEEYGISFDRTNPKVITMNSVWYNLGEYKAYGLDGSFTLKYPVADSQKLFLGVRASYLLDIQAKRTTEEFRSELGDWGYPFYRISSQLGVESNNGVRLALSINGVSGFNDKYTDGKRTPDAPHKRLWNQITGKESNQKLITDVEKYNKFFDKDSKLSDKDKENILLQIPAYFNFDLTASLPASLFGGSDKASWLFKIENIFDSDLPTSTQKRGQENLAAVTGSGMGGAVPNGMYQGINGRAYLVQYTQQF